MLEYIYFVKRPNCEDEHFDFFDEAKAFAMGCLTKKPIITQIEVCRNDFGECTDHCDLGTVWSWEDMMKETNSKADDSCSHVLCKADLKDIDSEFDDDDFFFMNNRLSEDVKRKFTFKNKDDFNEFMKLCSEVGIVTGADLKMFMKEYDATDFNLLDKLREYRAELGPDFKIKESITIGNSVNRFVIVGEKEDYTKQYYNQELDTWVDSSNDATLFDDRNHAIEVLYDLDKSAFYTTRVMIKLMPTTEDISANSNNFRKPIPEGMTIEQLVEEMEENEDTVECTWCEELFDKSECRKEVDLGWLCSRCEMAIKSRGETLTFKENNYWDFLDEKLDIDFSNCIDSSDHEIWGVEHEKDNIYKAVLLKRYENVSFRDSDECDRIHKEMYDIDGLFLFTFGKDGLPKLGRWDPELLNSLGNCEIIFDDDRYDQAVEETLNGSASKRESLNPGDLHDLGNEYDGGYPDETPEVSDSHLKLCPECGKETFDTETGICITCGFN